MVEYHVSQVIHNLEPCSARPTFVPQTVGTILRFFSQNNLWIIERPLSRPVMRWRPVNMLPGLALKFHLNFFQLIHLRFVEKWKRRRAIRKRKFRRWSRKWRHSKVQRIWRFGRMERLTDVLGSSLIICRMLFHTKKNVRSVDYNNIPTAIVGTKKMTTVLTPWNLESLKPHNTKQSVL